LIDQPRFAGDEIDELLVGRDFHGAPLTSTAS
jgi:hypothetical protein